MIVYNFPFEKKKQYRNNYWRLKSFLSPSNMRLLILLWIVFSSNAANGREWLYYVVQWDHLLSLEPNSPQQFMFGTTKGDTNSCFEFCYFTEQCNMIIESECCCYASDFPTIDTYYFTMSSSNQNKVWLKRPVHVCDMPGFIYYKEVCFKIFEENTKTWGDAKQECQLLGGRLIVLNSEYKHNTTVEALHNFSPNPYTGQYFVGATDIGSEDTWRWVDEQSIGSATYMKFHGNNPNNYDFHYPGEDANCGVLKMRHDGMVDDYCLQEKGFICEYVKGLP